MRFSSIRFQHFSSIESLRVNSPFCTMDRNASRHGFRHQQSRAFTIDGIYWVLIEEPTFQSEAHLGPDRKEGCTSSFRLLRFHFKQVKSANLYFAQCLRSLGGCVEAGRCSLNKYHPILLAMVGPEESILMAEKSHSSKRSWAYTGEIYFRLRLQKFVPGVVPQPLVRALTID